jgi:hypothetical protein
MPEINNLRLLKYSVTEMLTQMSPNPDNESMVRKLNQSAASIRQLETLHGEVPRVLKFTVGNASPAETEPESTTMREDLDMDESESESENADMDADIDAYENEDTM